MKYYYSAGSYEDENGKWKTRIVIVKAEDSIIESDEYGYDSIKRIMRIGHLDEIDEIDIININKGEFVGTTKK